MISSLELRFCVADQILNIDNCLTFFFHTSAKIRSDFIFALILKKEANFCNRISFYSERWDVILLLKRMCIYFSRSYKAINFH